ncbi:MAG: hypothetical protein ABSG75_07290 [Syntrophales bacterium]|jgi:hypothetical protein
MAVEETKATGKMSYDSMKEASPPPIPKDGAKGSYTYTNSPDLNKAPGPGIPQKRTGLKYASSMEPTTTPAVDVKTPFKAEQAAEARAKAKAEAEKKKEQTPAKGPGMRYPSMQSQMEAEAAAKAEAEARTKAETEAARKTIADAQARDEAEAAAKLKTETEAEEKRLADQVKKDDSIEVDPVLEAEFAEVGKVLVEKINVSDVVGWADEFTKTLLKIDGVKPSDLALVEAMKNQIAGLPEHELGPYKEWATSLQNWAFNVLRQKHNKKK